MKWPHASLTDQQVRDTFFIAPEFGDIYAMVLGTEGYESFKAQRQNIRAMGGDLLMIGWPDGSTITYQAHTRSDAIDLETLVETYQASAAMYRICRRENS